MKKIIFSITCLLLYACSSNDEPLLETAMSQNDVAYITVPDTSSVVTLETIKNISTNFNASSLTSRANEKEIESITAISSDNGTPLMYVINYKMNAGFLIISANKDYSPILAYNDTGNFDADGAKHFGTSVWLKEQKEIISNATDLPDSLKIKNRAQWEKYTFHKERYNAPKSRVTDNVTNLIMSSIASWEAQGYSVYQLSVYKDTSEFASLPTEVQERLLLYPHGYANENYGGVENVSYVLKKDIGECILVNPLLHTTWGQNNGYNQYTPNNYDAGCAAVAVGQIMKYYEYPKTFNWSDMADNYPTSTTAEFLSTLGDILQIKYSATGSSTNIDNIFDGLKQYGYTNITTVDHNSSAVISALRNKYPVLMTGHDGSDGHAWICDGVEYSNTIYEYKLMTLEDCPQSIEPTCFSNPYNYTDFVSYSPATYHMNWGWYGSQNGYYNDNNIEVEISNKKYNFSTNRKDIINIYTIK
jgi:hypothetical protein